MCTHHTPPRQATDRERAISLEHGHAHDHDHEAWTRRDFLVRSGFGAAAAIALGPARNAHAFVGGDLLTRLSAMATDRVLVLIQLKGGNDGLNTIVPVTNDLYYTARPTLALTAAQTVALSPEFGMHNALAPLQPLWGDGHMAVLHGVGYANSSLSHFTATDTWSTGRPSGNLPAGGWGGRALGLDFPDYETALPEHPPALQLGSQNPLMFQNGQSEMSMMVPSLSTLAQIAAGNGLYNATDVPATPSGAELGYIRSVANASNRYIGVVQGAINNGQNSVAYPTSRLGQELAAIARLIKGGLQSRIFVVSHSGFDTHANQLDTHTTLLGALGSSVAAFYADLGAAGHAARTLTMTFSEFGRRVRQNGSSGTDHGTAAPLFAFGPGVAGGLYGPAPNLAALDGSGNVGVTTDFRQAYATVLGSWFGLPEAEVTGVLGGAFSPVGFVNQPVSTPGAPAAELALAVPSPNPVPGAAQVRFSLPSEAAVQLDVFDVTGRRVSTVASGPHAPGEHAVALEAGMLPAGVYVLRLQAGRQSRTQRFTVVH